MLLIELYFSNIPGVVVEIAGKTLPIEDPTELIEAVDSVSYLHSRKLDSDDDEDDEDNNNNHNNNNNSNNGDQPIGKANKKRKHKRSKNK